MRRKRLRAALKFVIAIITFALSDLGAGAFAVAATSAIDFGGTNAYVSFGNPPALGLATFTVECWFRRDGTGIGTSTGTGGLPSAVPLVAKGRGEVDASNRDMNYFLGIQGSVIGSDFEEGAGGAAPGLNHPVQGVTAITNGIWYHAAVTYDGSALHLFLNGVQEGSLTVNQPPRSDSIQHAAFASALDSTGAAAGFFDGVIDEVRVWNSARSQAQIQAGMNVEIHSAPGLVGRWGLDEGSGASVGDSSGSGVGGTIAGTSYSWAAGAPSLSANQPPVAPILNSPAAGAGGVPTSPVLNVSVSDPEGGSLGVTFYGRRAPETSQTFTVVALPDTQFYSESYPDTYRAQTQWILDNRSALKIVFVTQLGDCVQNGDAHQSEWDNADAAVSLLEDPLATGLAEGLPFEISVGNHDQTPIGDPGTAADEGATTQKYNQTFGVSRYQGRSYYGGHYGINNDNHYELFSESGMDFIHISLEYSPNADALRASVLSWADSLLKSYGGRRAIVTSHYILNPNGTFGPQGQAIYDALKNNPNLFLMLCGHLDQAARRSDTFGGRTVQTLLSDFQTQPNGGNGWLRYMVFKPGEDKIEVHTYSPTLTQFKTDASNEFVLDYPMQAPPFTVIATNVGVPSGSGTTAVWSGLAAGAGHEWYVSVTDGANMTTGPIWTFTTQSPCTNPAPDDATCDGVDDDCDGSFDEDYVPAPTTCGTGACASAGTSSCVAGVERSSCVPGSPSREICDGLDNDCDGLVDDGNPGGGRECGPGDPGQCASMVIDCSGGSLTCSPHVGPAPEAADDLAFVDSATLAWSATSAASAYALYRGSKPGTGAFNHVCLVSPLALPSASDTQVPPPNSLFYYLVAGRNACGEGSLGRWSNGNERPTSSPCP